MKKNRITKIVLDIKRWRSLISVSIFVLFVAFLFSSCAAFLAPVAAIKGEELGAGMEAGIGSIPITQQLNLIGVAGYHFYKFNTGHDNFMKVGAQVRHQNQSSPLWFGGEFSVVRDVSIYDDSYWDENPSANGIAVGALAGYKLPVELMDMSIISGLSIINFGDFKSGDIVVEPSHSPIQFRIGLEIGIPFSK